MSGMVGRAKGGESTDGYIVWNGGDDEGRWGDDHVSYTRADGEYCRFRLDSASELSSRGSDGNAN